MKVIPQPLPDLLLIEPDVFGDARGFFLETYNENRYAAAGLACRFVQDNLSFSRRGILRGLHFQNPRPQGKLVQVLQGEVLDVAVDVRESSPTFGQWHTVHLSGENKRQLWVPPGYAHGFLVLSEAALFYYKCTELYSPQHEWTLRWDDPAVGIRWPVDAPLLSAKDENGLALAEIPRERLRFS